MPQFPIPPGKKEGETVTIGGPDVRHLTTVLRARPGETLRLFDGEGNRFDGRIETVGRAAVSVRLVTKLPLEQPRGTLRIGQALLKGDKMEWVLQKAAELGIASFHPFVSARTVAPTASPSKFRRWIKIADEACKQCGRASRMKMEPIVSLKDLLSDRDADLKIICWEEGGQPVREFFRQRGLQSAPAPSLLCLIGPEGGFSREEIANVREAGFACLSLGGRILRAETAAIVTASLIQYELGNI